MALNSGRSFDADSKAVEQLIEAGYVIPGSGLSPEGKREAAAIEKALVERRGA